MNNDLTKAIGLELAEIRKLQKYSIVEVSKKTKINKDTISKYENGNSSVKIYILDLLLEFYNVSLDIFFKNVNARMQKYKEEV